MSFLKRLFPALAFGSIFALVVYSVTPPPSWNEASIFQILSFFIPLLFFLTFFINLFLKYLPYSFIIACGFTILLALLSIGFLNPLSLILILLVIVLFFKLYPKLRYPRLSLTNKYKIPKLSRFERKKRR